MTDLKEVLFYPVLLGGAQYTGPTVHLAILFFVLKCFECDKEEGGSIVSVTD